MTNNKVLYKFFTKDELINYKRQVIEFTNEELSGERKESRWLSFSHLMKFFVICIIV
jgi:hypothetical protein